MRFIELILIWIEVNFWLYIGVVSFYFSVDKFKNNKPFAACFCVSTGVLLITRGVMDFIKFRKK